MTPDELKDFKKMVYAGKSDICWYVHRWQVKELIAIIENIQNEKNTPIDECLK